MSVLELSRRALGLVWQTSPTILIWLAVLSTIAGALPAAVPYAGKMIVDAVAPFANRGLREVLNESAVAQKWLLLEAGLVLALAAAQRGLTMCDTLLRAMLAQRVNEMILEKALTLTLTDFEDSEFYDRMTRARRDASWRPLSLVKRALGLLQNLLSLFLYGALLLRFSGWAVLVLAVAALPAFWAEKAFSEQTFSLFRWRSPDTRMQNYLETLLAREDHAKEVTLFRLGPRFLQRYRDIFRRLFAEERGLIIRRSWVGFLLGGLSTLAFYATYAFIIARTLAGTITLGDMTMYLLVFKQGQGAIASLLSSLGGIYEDNLYLSTLFEYLDHPSQSTSGSATEGPDPGDGIRFHDVSFAYEGAEKPALRHVTLHIPPGSKLALVGENGAGKTTLIKLLTRLYEPTSGKVTLDGLDLREWQPDALRRRIGVIFQDFIRYQLRVGENVGAGDVESFEDHEAWQRAAVKGMADPFIQKLPSGYDTQLGKWFKDGQELSIGQWQKIALSRAFMREQADILVLDEPTASMDAEAEAEVFQRFRALSDRRMGIVISHRFSTVRMADQIVVLVDGEIVEHGSHDQLMARSGRYARLFNLQAEGYR
ncbi:MAG TPA: ABC transporter ATP-binding protein [Polyangiales bacterium]|nr:ABC transporter ATP-binding protein [Polyangiales bacterium]